MTKIFKNVNERQTPTNDSQSFLMNNAAKDDALSISGLTQTTFNLSQLLANDPGSAQFVSFAGAGVSYDALTGDFTVDPSAAGFTGEFTYIVRLANGTYSQASVDFAVGQAGQSLFMENFGSYITSAQWVTANLASTGWTYGVGSAGTEVVVDGYMGIDGTEGGAWLDTQGSPGPINISHAVGDTNDGQALLTFSVAAQEFGSFESAGTLDFYWNGMLVESVDRSELGANGVFQEFNLVVDSAAGGANTLTIQDTGPATVVGFALDYVQVSDWIIV